MGLEMSSEQTSRFLSCMHRCSILLKPLLYQSQISCPTKFPQIMHKWFLNLLSVCVLVHCNTSLFDEVWPNYTFTQYCAPNFFRMQRTLNKLSRSLKTEERLCLFVHITFQHDMTFIREPNIRQEILNFIHICESASTVLYSINLIRLS